jgi:hypothetical protein
MRKILVKIYKTFSVLPITDKVTVGIFILILIISALFFLRKAEYVFVTVNVTHDASLTFSEWGKPPAWYIDKLKPGISEKDSIGREQIKVEDVYRYNANGADSTSYYNIILKIKCVYNKKNNQYSYNGIPILIGSYQKFTVNNFQVNGFVQSISNNAPSQEIKTLYVKGFLDAINNGYPTPSSYIKAESNQIQLDGIPKNISSKIYEGMKIVDSKGSNIVLINHIQKIPAKIRVISSNDINYISDPENEKVELELQIQATMINGKPYYNQINPIAINTLLQLNFPDIKLALTITDIQPSP